MATLIPSPDKSNGYEEFAEHIMHARNVRIGPRTVKEWSKSLPLRSAVLDLGCGSGMPISQALVEEGFQLYGVDASQKMIHAFRDRFPSPLRNTRPRKILLSSIEDLMALSRGA